MAKIYTAQEMRELADKIWDYKTMSKGLELCDNELEQVDCEATHDLIYMLRQAADTLEREVAELRERLRVSSNAMEIVVQWLGKYPKWQELLRDCVAENRKAAGEAADALDREKKYEYTHKYGDDVIDGNHTDDVRRCFVPMGAVMVRRSVGEWEEVRDKEGVKNDNAR